jgi:transcriptional regulator with XRE-family HTH domain
MNLNCEIGERLFQLQNALKKKQREFAADLGFKSGNGLSMIQKGKNPLQADHCKILELTFNVNIDWLKTGTGEMFKQIKVEHKPEPFEAQPIVLLAKIDVLERKVNQLISLHERNEKRVDMLIEKILTEGRHNENLSKIIMLLTESGILKRGSEIG